jgi:hypothetical protein
MLSVTHTARLVYRVLGGAWTNKHSPFCRHRSLKCPQNVSEIKKQLIREISSLDRMWTQNRKRQCWPFCHTIIFPRSIIVLVTASVHIWETVSMVSKCKGTKYFLVHAMKACRGMALYLHSFSASALYEGELCFISGSSAHLGTYFRSCVAVRRGTVLQQWHYYLTEKRCLQFRDSRNPENKFVP